MTKKMRGKRTLSKTEKKIEKLAEKRVKVKSIHKVLDAQRLPTKTAVLSNAKSFGDLSDTNVTIETAAAIVDPFRAYEMGARVGLPFDQTAAMHYGMWTRDVIELSAVEITAGSLYGVAGIIYPWMVDHLSYGTTITTAGVVTASTAVNSSAASFITSNFSRVVCTHIGVRVRNLAPPLSQAGVLVVGEMRNATAFSATLSERRLNAKSYGRAAAGSEVTAQLNWIGDTDGDVEATDAIVDYQLSDVSGDTFDDELTVLYVQYQGSHASSFEIEVVRHYLCVPTFTNYSLFPLQRNTVNVNQLLNMLDRCYNKVPRFDLLRCAVKDDGNVFDDLKGIWGGLKALTRLPGSAWQSMVSGLHELGASENIKDVLRHIKPHEYKQMVNYLNSHTDWKSAFKGAGLVEDNNATTSDDRHSMAVSEDREARKGHSISAEPTQDYFLIKSSSKR